MLGIGNPARFSSLLDAMRIIPTIRNSLNLFDNVLSGFLPSHSFFVSQYLKSKNFFRSLSSFPNYFTWIYHPTNFVAVQVKKIFHSNTS